MNSAYRVMLGALFCLAPLGAQAAGWNEAVSGDLSNDRFAPTLVSVVPGKNIVLGSTGNSGQGVDRDYFKINVPSGYTLRSIRLLGNTTVSGGASFLAIESGPQILVTPTGGGVSNLLGYTHYAPDQIDTDILPAMLIGVSPPLPSATYAFWVQDTGGPATYGFEFLIESIAESGDVPVLPVWAAALMAAAFLVPALGRGGWRLR